MLMLVLITYQQLIDIHKNVLLYTCYQKENLQSQQIVPFCKMLGLGFFFIKKVLKTTQEVLWEQNQMRHLCD